MITGIQHFLRASYFINSDHPIVIEEAARITVGIAAPKDKAIALYYAVRDGFRYNPYNLRTDPSDSRASTILSRETKDGHCIDKAVILCALSRAVGIPARLHFANVRNHIGTAKLEEHLGTNLLVFHGFMEFLLDGNWVKATPAFNKGLCDKLGVAPLEFDGENDSIFQEYDRDEGGFMEYVHDYGVFHDFPLDMFVREICKHYAHLFEK